MKEFNTFEEMDVWSKTLSDGDRYAVKVINDTMSFSGDGLWDVHKDGQFTHLMETEDWMLKRAVERGAIYNNVDEINNL